MIGGGEVREMEEMQFNIKEKTFDIQGLRERAAWVDVGVVLKRTND